MQKTFTKLVGRLLRLSGLAVFLIVLSQANLHAQYCVPTTGLDCALAQDEWITDVTVNGVSNPSGCSTYSDFSSSVTFSGIQAQNIPLSISLNISTFIANDDVAVFIDWNNDFDFNDADELVFQQGFNGPNMTNPQTGSFLASGVAPPGFYRMRVYLSYNQTTPDPCATTWLFGEAEDYTFELLQGTNCTGTPNDGIASGPSNACSGTNFTISATGLSTGELGLTYIWQSSTDGGTSWADISGATNSSYTLSQTVATQYRIITNCAPSGLSAVSNTISVAMSPFWACYCSATAPYGGATSIADEDIGNVTLAGNTVTLNNTTTCTSPASTAPGVPSIPSQYQNYTDLSSIPDLGQALDYPLTLTSITCGGNFGNGFKVWIDFDQNGVFDDATETVYNSSASTTGPHTENAVISVPSTATLGQTGMLVKCSEEIFPSANLPCDNITWGEAELYLVNIVATAGCLPTSFASYTLSNNAVGSATISWGAPASAVSYNVRYKKVSDPTSVSTWANPINQTGTSIDLTGLETCEQYEIQVQVDCGSDVSIYTASYIFNTVCYCTPTTTICDEFISNVIIGTNQNPTGCTTGGFNDYTSLSYNVSASTAEVITVEVGNLFTGDDISIFVDWNQDLDFNDPGELFYSQADLSASPVVANVNIPAVADGNYRMRVRLYFNTGFEDPCATSTFGEIEDYTLAVGPPPSCIGVTGITASNITLTTADISWNASATAESYNIRYKTTLEDVSVSTWANPINTTNTSITLTGIDTCKTYQVQVQSVCPGGDTSTYSFTYTFASACYCTATTTICDEFISNVTIGTTSNPTGCTPGGYTNYSSSVSFDVEAGACAQVTVENGVNTYVDDQCGVWIDWNADLDFNDPGETIPVTGSPGAGPYIGQITVPGNQTPGTYRMRVRITFTGAVSPCGNTTFGEVEDYSINVIPGGTCPGVGIVNLGGQTFASVTLDWVTGAESYNVRYKLPSEDETVATWVNPINTTTVPFELTGLDSCTQYEIQVQAVCAGGEESPYSCSVFFGTLCCLDPLPLSNYVEQEACGEDNNGGCNSSPNAFETVSCGAAIAGTAWWNGNTRDTDWYLLNISQTQSVDVTLNAAFLGQILIFDAANGCPPAGVPLNNIAATQQCEAISFAGNLPAGNYWVVALPQFDFNETYLCGSGKNNYMLSIECNDPVPPPANDSCQFAIAVNCGDTISGSTVYATPDAGLPFCGTTPQSNGVWYTLDGDGSFVTLSLCNGTSYDSKINVFTGSCDAFTCVAGNDDFCGLQSQVTFQSVLGTTYYIYVNGFTASSGDFSMSVTCEFPPAYDNVCGALPLNIGINGPFNTVLGSTEAGEPVPPATGCETTTGWCISSISNTLWFTFEAPASGHVSVHSPGFDTQLGIWSAADCDAILNGGATLVAANDDDANFLANGGAQFSSYLELTCLTPGATYYVQLDPYTAPGAQTPIILTDLGPLASSDFSGLEEAYCNGASAVTLTPVTPGGTFAGPGVTGSVFNPVAAGVGGPYEITYTLETCNVTTKTTTVEQITANASATATSCGLDNGAIDLTAGGGSSLTYSWSNGSTNEDLSDLSADSYDVTVTSAAGCTATTSATVDPSIGVTILSDITDETCGEGNGAIDITAFGNGTTTYLWSNSSTDEDLFNLVTNTYNITVTDDNGCSASDVILVPGTPAVVLSGISNNVNCGVPGSIDISVDSGTSPYTYNWSNGATTEDLTNIQSDEYTVTVTDINGCSSTYDATITGVGSEVNVNVTPTGPLASCHMAFNITLSANTITDVEYTWIRGQFGQGYTIVQDGGTTYQPNTPGVRNYFVIATDTVTGCADTSNTVLVELSTFDKPEITVGNCVNQTVLLSTTNYGAGYTYEWYNAADPIPGANSNTYTATTWGGYRIFVTDSCGISKFSEPISLSTDCFKTTSIDQINSQGNGINIYPNPNNGSFNVELMFEGANYNNANFEIFNIIGQRVMNKEITFINGYVNVPVSMNDILADGVYTIRVQLGTEEVVRKVVVNRN